MLNILALFFCFLYAAAAAHNFAVISTIKAKRQAISATTEKSSFANQQPFCSLDPLLQKLSATGSIAEYFLQTFYPLLL